MVEPSEVAEIERVIQLAIAPAFLLTAMATLINVLAGRLARVVDRERAVRDGAAEVVVGERRILVRRAWAAYRAIVCGVLAATLICLLIVTSFVGAFFELGFARAVGGLLVLAMFAAIAALGYFLVEIRIAARNLPNAD